MNDLNALLQIYLEWGIDTAISPTPTNKAEYTSTTRYAAKKTSRPVPNKKLSNSSHPLTPQQLKKIASQQATKAQDLTALKHVIDHFNGFTLCKTALHNVIPHGPQKAVLMIIGEAPDDSEDRSGRPFSGESGRILENILHYLPLKKAQIILSTAIPWRPPGGRPPNKEEQDICRPFLQQAIELMKPQHILLCGRVAMNMLLEKRIALPQKRWINYTTFDGKEIPVMTMRHPLQLKTSPKARQEIWETMMHVTKTLLNYP